MNIDLKTSTDELSRLVILPYLDFEFKDCKVEEKIEKVKKKWKSRRC